MYNLKPREVKSITVEGLNIIFNLKSKAVFKVTLASQTELDRQVMKIKEVLRKEELEDILKD